MQTKSVAIVTGASQGIGRVTAFRLARDFGAVVLAARQEDELKKTAAEVQSAGHEALTYALDSGEPRSVETIVQCTLDRFGRIDALLNIAGAVPQIDLFGEANPLLVCGTAGEAIYVEQRRGMGLNPGRIRSAKRVRS